MESQNSSKVNFFLGFFAGLALISVVGFFVLLGLMMGGAKNTDSVVQAGNEKPSVVADQPSGQVAQVKPVRAIDKNDHYVGKLNAPVQLIIYDDFECPFCLRHEDTVKQLMADYGDKIVLSYRYFPLSFHKYAQKAAEAAECAAAQGKFFEMKDKLFALQKASDMGVDQFKKAAQELKLNTGKFNDCLDKGTFAQKIADEANEGSTFGVEGTPGNFVNGQFVSGALPYSQFKTIIDGMLK